MLASLAHGKVNHGSNVVRVLSAPKELKFELDDASKGYISKAEADFDALIGKHELLVRLFYLPRSYLSSDFLPSPRPMYLGSALRRLWKRPH